MPDHRALPSRATCATCKYWGNPRMDTAMEWRTCSRIRDDRNHTEDYEPSPGSIALVWDTEGYHAALDTHASFGCVLWDENTLPVEAAEWEARPYVTLQERIALADQAGHSEDTP